ncbi:hypothetical protein E2320_022382, partial [Naja naja]
MLLLILMLFWFLAPTTAKRLQTICVFKRYIQVDESYYRPGDVIIGGNLPLGIIAKSPVLNFNTVDLPLQKTNTSSSFYTVLLGVGFQFCKGDRRVYPSFFQINPEESPQYVGLVQLLLHFQWNWVGLMAPEDERGEHLVTTLTPMLQEREICLVSTEMLKLDDIEITVKTLIHIFQSWSTEVFIVIADLGVTVSVAVALHFFEKFIKVSLRKVFIYTSHWKLGMGQSEDKLQAIKLFHGVLHFRDHSRDVSEFSHFLLSLDPLNPQGDIFLLP